MAVWQTIPTVKLKVGYACLTTHKKNEVTSTKEVKIMTPEEKHEIVVLRGKIAHKTGVEREEALAAYWEAKRRNGHSTDYKLVALPLRYSGTAA